MDLSDWISRRADLTPGKSAIEYAGTVLSYAELAGKIDRFANVLGTSLEVQPGDRVAYLGLNSPEFIALLFACARVGAVLLPLNWRLAAPEHVQLLQHAGPVALFVEEKFIAHVDTVAEQFGSIQLINFEHAYDGWTSLAELDLASRREQAFSRPVGLSEADGLLLCYTSGTTGTPKGALLSKRALLCNAQNSVHMHTLTSQDKILTILPMFHVGGLNIQTLPALYAGATVVLHRRFDVDGFFAELAERHITLTLVVPTIMLAIMDDPRWSDTRPGSLRMISVGSTIVSADLVTEVCNWGVPMVQVYGSTETGPIAAYTPATEAARKPASTGKVAVHCELRIVDEAGDEVEVGNKGEILVRGENLMTAYWCDAEATREVFTDQWLHTGDVGHLDAEGFLYVDGRIKDMIISGGENIYPALIENLLSARPEIEEVAVVGRPDDYWGEVAVAVVVTSEGSALDAEQVLGFCSGQISRFSCPREVIVVEQLPRNAMGKVLKGELRQQVIQKWQQQNGQKPNASGSAT